MADIGQRVTVLENMLETLPDDLNVRFDNAQAERDQIKAQISRLQADVSEIKAEMKVLPRVIAELIKS